MTRRVGSVELHGPDPAATDAFMWAMAGWQTAPFAAPGYLVAPHGDAPGVGTGLLASQAGRPRTVPVIRAERLADATALVTEHGGTVVVEPFTLPGVGSGCSVADLAGLLTGPHADDAAT